MHVHAIDVAAVVIAVAVVSATIAIIFDRRFYQDRKIKEWTSKNEQFIAELQQKAAGVQNKLNSVYGQLLALGVKLPRETAPAPVPAPPAPATPVLPSYQSEKRYE